MIKFLQQHLKVTWLCTVVLAVAGLGLISTPVFAGAAMQIFVKTPTGQTLTMDVEDSDEVIAVKQKVLDKKDIPVEDQEITYGGITLEDEKMLSFYGIGRDATLHLVLQAAPAIDAVAAPGNTTNSTRLLVNGTISGNTLYTKVINSPVTTPYMYTEIDPVTSGLSAYLSGNDIPSLNLTTDRYIVVYELDSSNRVMRFKLIELTTSDIKNLVHVTAATPTDPADPIVTAPAPTLANTGDKLTPIIAVYSVLSLAITSLTMLHRPKPKSLKH